jgi:hypothetical protein
VSLWDNPVLIVSTLALLSSIIIYYKNRKIRSIRYSLLANAPLLTIAEDLTGKIKIYYEQSPNNNIQIKDSALLIIKIVNDGNTAIKSGDFEEPIRITFRPEVMILSAETIETSPATLVPKLELSKDQIIIEPLLLNEKDSITIKALLTGFRDDTKILPEARIVGIKGIKAVEPKKNYRNRITARRPLFILGAILGAITVLSIFLVFNNLVYHETIQSVISISTLPDLTFDNAKYDPIGMKLADSNKAPAVELSTIRFSGKDRNTSQVFTLKPGLYIVAMNFLGSGNFIGDLMNSDGTNKITLVNWIGKYKGAKALGISKPGDYRLDISNVNGPWTVNISQLKPPQTVQNVPLSFSGKGPQVSQFFKLRQGPVIFNFDHDGNGRFDITVLNSDGNAVSVENGYGTLINASKAMTVDVDRIYCLGIDADYDFNAEGNWKIDIIQ